MNRLQFEYAVAHMDAHRVPFPNACLGQEFRGERKPDRIADSEYFSLDHDRIITLVITPQPYSGSAVLVRMFCSGKLEGHLETADKRDYELGVPTVSPTSP